ncbi:OLC1v1006603C1 [Oldenlandia corymbosa var. corymbosa]|uniref:OLC1v1006603C1 n=1 Tax=Oldenlandia corymbosa var. corymbosa TaxID=529605 RepID=A0AAV1DHH3_OLDCO|nr:OLC1v1006603C1 [Oldenlandia corymbosa var. corymbosa]
MAASDWAVECLRPFVQSSMWDYCIVWQFGVDPSSFMQWRGCCCRGGNDEEFVNVKTESGSVDHSLNSRCRDEYAEHPIRTKACEKLCKLPSSLPLYSGIRGEVVLSNQPRWLVEDARGANSVEGLESQVLVPVEGGLVELCSTKKVPADHQIINFILALFGCVKQETMAGEPHYKQFLDEGFPNFPETMVKADSTSTLQLPVPVSNLGFYPSFEGSFACSNISKDCQLLTLGPGPASCQTSPEESSATYPRKLNSITRRNPRCPGVAGNEGPKSKKRKDEGNYKSKNLVTERKRRQKIKTGIFRLRSLVPNISKMDISATLGDAYDYIQELQMTEKMYKEELKILTEECNEYEAEQEVPKLNAKLNAAGDRPTCERDSCTDYEDQAKEGIAVSQLDASDFLVEIISRKRHGGFSRLMQALDSYGLQVIDANVTTLNGLVRSIFKVQASSKEIHPENLKGSLMELLSQDV